MTNENKHADKCYECAHFANALKKEFILDVIEVQNETDRSILASACRSRLTNNLYIHIGKAHGKEVKIKPHSAAEIVVRLTDC